MGGSSSFKLSGKLQDYKLLIKFNLSFMVVFSALISYLLAPKVKEYDWASIILFFVGGMLVTGSANTINQIVEKDTDALMKRTANRPVASGRMSTGEAWAFAVIAGIVGVLILWHFNLLTAVLAAFSLFVYAFIYTPLKKVSSISVLVGAIPGSLPCLIGWAAGNDDLSAGGWALFALQFFWQFPHFWAIAWVADDDYKKAGFKLLPSGGGKDLNTAIQIMVYTMFLIPLGLLPARFGVTGLNSAIVATVCGVAFFAQTFSLLKTGNRQSALRIMFGSFLYLPIVQIAYLLDKV